MNLANMFAEATANPLALAAAILAVSMYYPLCRRISKGGVRQNLATFVLWGMFDGIAAVSILLEGGNWLLPAFYTIGCCFVIATIWKTRTFTLGLTEYAFGALVVVCMIVWFFVSNEAATIVSTIALLLAGVPQLRDTWLRPHEAPIDLYLGFTLANILSTFAGSEWTIAERLYPAACSVLTFVFVLFALRKRWQKDAAIVS